MLRILTLSLIGGLLSASGDAGPTANQVPEYLQAEIKRAMAGDLATSMNAAMDNSEAMLSSGMYRAIQAVQAYRNREQKAVLTNSERDFNNFNIKVMTESDDTPGKWLRESERRHCYMVRLSARRMPGEPIYTDTPARLGRTAFFAVRKSDFRIVRAEIDAAR